MEILYLSYDGMTDPLGQSQVLPYLSGLSNRGHTFTLLSCEKPHKFEKNKQKIYTICQESKINWIPLKYHKKPPIISAAYDYYQLRKHAIKQLKQKKFDFIHCRGHYLTSLAASNLNKRFGGKYIFDMRGFWADERIDGGLWSKQKYIYKKLYNFFKKKEIEFINHANEVITLTEKAKDEILGWEKIKENLNITVIPCCADLEHFNKNKIPSQKSIGTKKKLGYQDTDKILIYIGSIGTWYLLEEMLKFFKTLKAKEDKYKMLFVTLEDKNIIRNISKDLGLQKEDIKIISSDREQLPLYLSTADLGIAFIKPLYSKKGSSAVKMGEMMAMGIPIVCNDIGDTGKIMKKYNAGYVVEKFNKESFEKTIDEIIQLPRKTEDIIKTAKEYYDLKQGINKYAEIYEK